MTTQNQQKISQEFLNLIQVLSLLSQKNHRQKFSFNYSSNYHPNRKRSEQLSRSKNHSGIGEHDSVARPRLSSGPADNLLHDIIEDHRHRARRAQETDFRGRRRRLHLSVVAGPDGQGG